MTVIYIFHCVNIAIQQKTMNRYFYIEICLNIISFFRKTKNKHEKNDK